MSSARIVCLSRAAAPITHMAGTAGNESLILRTPVQQPDGTDRQVPAISGNHMRNRTLRTPGAQWLVDEYGLRGFCTLTQLNFLFHGGSLTDSTGRENTALIAELHECSPLFKLLGGCRPEQMLGGSARVSHAWVCCEQSRTPVGAILGDEALRELPPLLPAEWFVRKYQNTTSGVREKNPALAESAPDFAESESDPRMIYTGECVMTGAYFAHDYTLMDPTVLDIGAALWSLDLWQRSGGVVGGMGAKGHGKLFTRVLIEGCDVPPQECVTAYLRHARGQKDRFRAWLEAAFGAPKEKKPAKAKAPPKGKAKPAPEPAPGAEPTGDLFQ
ncbi:hypothetical protein VT84_09475 [Gemmata sp. SH-PL17]|uniref:hypothetical protein n=1 Tax=Gemmata sp. SH-PL17 TaxID=1630693 RepID=UPI00078B6799|nr:hypothetical protein [Gemmata sp. SH-PL17]AMV24614.1 hypothetical protein VT84_09475 [Gemmata sp. SH-PL17]